MKRMILCVLLLLAVNALAQTNIYRFSGAYIVADESYALDNADEILSLENSAKHALPEFYFSAGGEYGVTNWSEFPNTAYYQIGAEFKLEVSKETDREVSFSTWSFKYCYLTGWDGVRERPRFDKSGMALIDSEQTLQIGENHIIYREKEHGVRGWLIARIDKVDTPSANWSPAQEDQLKPILGLLQVIQSDEVDADFVRTLSHMTGSNTELSDKRLVEFIGWAKDRFKKTFGTVKFGVDDFRFLYTGGADEGTVKFIYKNGAEDLRDIIKIDSEWKLKS